MWLEVDPPALAQEPTFGLLAAVGDRAGEAGWEHGIVWRSEGGRVQPQIVDPCATDLTDLPDVIGRSYVLVKPVSFRVRDFWQGRPDLMDDQLVVRAAAAVTSSAVAKELWEGEGAQADPWTRPAWLGGDGTTTELNPFLADGHAATIGGTFGANDGIAALEQVARERSGSTVPIVIHVPPMIGQLAAQYLTRVGNTLRTASGSVVVADAGYTGKGAGSATGMWGYATGPIVVRLGPLVESTGLTETTDRRHNARETWAQRTFEVGFDPAVHVAASFDVPALTVTDGS